MERVVGTVDGIVPKDVGRVVGIDVVGRVGGTVERVVLTERVVEREVETLVERSELREVDTALALLVLGVDADERETLLAAKLGGTVEGGNVEATEGMDA